MQRPYLLALTLVLCALPLAAKRRMRDPERSLTVIVDLNSVESGSVVKPRHELAFQLERKNLSERACLSQPAPGGEVEILQLFANAPAAKVATLALKAESAHLKPTTVAPGGYVYRQLFLWQGWRKAAPGRYLARYRSSPELQATFQLP